MLVFKFDEFFSVFVTEAEEDMFASIEVKYLYICA